MLRKHLAWHPSLIEASTYDMLAAVTITVLPALPRTLGLRYAVLWGARIHTSNLLNQIPVAPRWGTQRSTTHLLLPGPGRSLLPQFPLSVVLTSLH